jgi:RHS repeat-associated protein
VTDRRFLMTDPRGSVIAVANSSGTVTNINKYDDYGAPAAGNVGRFQYTGQMWLAEAGLYHYKARAYHPELGRFLQADPIGYGDGLNLYAYVGNDPVNTVDPTGTLGKSPADLRAVHWIDADFRGSALGGFGGGAGGFGAGGGQAWRTCVGGGGCRNGFFPGNGAALYFGQTSGRGANPNRPEVSGGGSDRGDSNSSRQLKQLRL